MSAGALVMPRRKKGDKPTQPATPTRLWDSSLMIVRKLSGHLNKSMSDVASELILEHGQALLDKLMKEELKRRN